MALVAVVVLGGVLSTAVAMASSLPAPSRTAAGGGAVCCTSGYYTAMAIEQKALAAGAVLAHSNSLCTLSVPRSSTVWGWEGKRGMAPWPPVCQAVPGLLFSFKIHFVLYNLGGLHKLSSSLDIDIPASLVVVNDIGTKNQNGWVPMAVSVASPRRGDSFNSGFIQHAPEWAESPHGHR